MEQLPRTQRMLVVAVALLLAVIFIGLVFYYTLYAPGHPHYKHDVLFIVLTVASLLVAWFAWPSSRTTA